MRQIRRALRTYRNGYRLGYRLGYRTQPHEIAESEEEETTKFHTTEDEYFLAWYGMVHIPKTDSVTDSLTDSADTDTKPVVVRLPRTDPRTPKQKPNYIFTKPPDKDDET